MIRSKANTEAGDNQIQTRRSDDAESKVNSMNLFSKTETQLEIGPKTNK